MSLDQAVHNELTLKIPWEESLQPGPVGEYVEVIDFDAESGVFYAPVDLNTPSLLVQHGLPPAEGVPQFHQQMVYALMMCTIQSYERALGRTVLWSPYVNRENSGEDIHFVKRLRAYPHAIRTQQTHYSPLKKALLIGYSQANVIAGDGEPARATSFSCLSFGVVAHETAHAILDGLGWAVTLEECGIDELAVHEAIADLTGLLQQFAAQEFIRNHVRLTSDLDENQRAIGELARRFAQPGVHAELRKYIGATEARAFPMNPRVPSFQERAALLVAAVFHTFMAVWRNRCERLLALGDQEMNRRQPLSGEMLNCFSAAAARCASRMLQICIRAIDYCPPVDVTAGDFLRAAITADADLFPEDERRFRVALVEGFRMLGLYPLGVKTLSPLQLLWQPPKTDIFVNRVLQFGHGPASSREHEFSLERSQVMDLFGSWLTAGTDVLNPESIREMGLAIDSNAPRTIDRGSNTLPNVTVTTCRLARRVGHDGRFLFDWVIKITQRRRGYFDEPTQKKQDMRTAEDDADFILRGGCTLLVDAVTGRARLCIAKDVLSDDRLAEYRQSAQQRMSVLELLGNETRDRLAEPYFLLRGGRTDPAAPP
jgi:hypothetical protein